MRQYQLKIIFFAAYCFLKIIQCQIQTVKYARAIDEINAVISMDDQLNCYLTFFTEVGDLSQPYNLGICMNSGYQSDQKQFVPYFVDNNKIYMKKGDRQFNIIDIQAIKNNDQQNFIHEIELVQKNVDCKEIDIQKQENSFFLFCRNNHGPFIFFQDTTLDRVLASNNQQLVETHGVNVFLFDYGFYTNVLFYKGKKIDFGFVGGIIIIDVKFDIFIFDSEAKSPNSKIILCQIDFNRNSEFCKQKIEINFQISFFSEVIQSNDMNLLIFGNSTEFGFLNVDTFTPLITSPKIQRTLTSIKSTVIIDNSLIVQQDQVHLKFNYNPHSMEVELNYLQSDFLSSDNQIIKPNRDYYGFQKEIQFKKGNIFVQYEKICTISNIYQAIPLCTDYCSQCGSTNYQVCQKCQNGYYLQIDNTCALTCPASAKIDSIIYKCECCSNSTKVKNECQCNDQYYLNGNECFPCPSNCQKCSDQHTCQICLPQFYLLPDLTCGYCDTKNGYFIQQNKCLPCHSSCQQCSGYNENQCMKCNQSLELYLFQNSTCKKCNIIEPYFINEGYCQVCDKQCKTCFGASQDQCNSCYEGYGLNKNTCQQIYLVYEANIFSESRITQIKELSESSSSTVVASTFVMSLLQNIGSNSSFGILVSGLTIQNLVYLYLFDANIPKSIYSALKILSGKLPSQQLLFLNPLSKLIDENLLQYQNAKYQEVNLPFHIIINCGQAVVLFFICTFLFLLFFVLIEKINQERVKQVSIKVYQSLFSSLIVQYFQLVMSILVIGVNQQIKEFFIYQTIEQLPIKQILTLIFFALIVIILYQQYKYLNKLNLGLSYLGFKEITIEKILNETIYDCKIRRNFMLIYLVYELILLPTFYIQLSHNWKAVNTVAIILKINLLIIIIYFKPFFSKLTNIYFIFNHLFWLLLQIQYMVLNSLCEQSNIQEYVQSIENISLTFLINLQIVQLITPLYMLLTVSLQLYDLIRKKMKEKFLQQQEEELDQIIIYSINASNINIELSQKKTQIVDIFKKKKKSLKQQLDQTIEDQQEVENK
ncbi:hypothetical protein ABPG74_015739 [Tetrahymena malaccensis]